MRMRSSQPAQRKSARAIQFRAAFMALLLSCMAPAGLLVAQNKQTLTFVVQTGNQPEGGVSIYVLTSSNKFSSDTPPAGTTDGSGAFALPPGLFSANKPHSSVEIHVRICVDGKKQLFVIPERRTDLLPQPTNDCKDDRLGILLWVNGATYYVNLAPGGGVTQTNAEPAATTPPSHNAVSTSWLAPSVEFRGFGGEVVNGNNPTTAGFDGGVRFRIVKIFVLGGTAGYQRINNAVTSSIGSMTPGHTFVITRTESNNGVFAGLFGIPVSRFELDGRVGAIVSALTSTQNGGFCGGTTPTGPTTTCTIVSTTTTDGTSVKPFFAAAISYRFLRHFAAFAEFQNFGQKITKPSATNPNIRINVVDKTQNVVVFGISFTVGGPHEK